MSPEQALGRSNIDHRTDIWSLGIIAFEGITGSRPFDQDSIGGLISAICHEPLPIPSEFAQVPAGFNAWFARASARNPLERFASVAEATSELRVICGLPSVRPSVAAGAQGSEGTMQSVSNLETLPMQAEMRPDLVQTAGPASNTIHRTEKAHLRWPGIALGAVLAVLAISIAIWRLTAPRPTLPVSAAAAAQSVTLPTGLQQDTLASGSEQIPAGPVPTVGTNATTEEPRVRSAPLPNRAKQSIGSAQPAVAGTEVAPVASASPEKAPAKALRPAAAPEPSESRARKMGLEQANPFATPAAP
jgi:serine/threonine-protein kinase